MGLLACWGVVPVGPPLWEVVGNDMRGARLDYGNWVSRRLIVSSVVAALLFFALSLVAAVFLAGAVVFLLACGYFTYARWKFSPRGGDLQGQIRQLVVDRVVWDGLGEALDIGCGNGPLVIALARKFPSARVIGVDLWGGLWEYSQAACEANARGEGVAERVAFRHASASSLPFEDGSFDVVVSNLVFHEVKDTADKTLVVKEALRVLRNGGCFVFQDLFKLRRLYGGPDDLPRTIREWGVARVAFVDTGRSSFIPRALRLPFIVGTLGLLHGVK